jgi:hypothetical protein
MLRALDLLSAGELGCYIRKDRAFQADRCVRANPEVFRPAFAMLLCSPSSVWNWLGTLRYLGSSRVTYWVSGAEADRLLAPPTPDWRNNSVAHCWEPALLLPKAEFDRILDKAFPACFQQPAIRKPRVVLETAHALLASHGPELDQEAVAAEARHAIRCAGYLNATLRDARQNDGTVADPTTRGDEGWVIAALKGEHARIKGELLGAQTTNPDSEPVETIPEA